MAISRRSSVSRRRFVKGVLATGFVTLMAACGAKAKAPIPVGGARTVPPTTVPPTTLPAPKSAWKPVVLNSRDHQLAANGSRLLMAGVVVIGVPGQNQFTADFATGQGVFSQQQGQYPNRDVICATVRAWGGNAIRLRYTSTDIAAQTFGWSTGRYLRCIQDWVTSAKAHGLYTILSDWSAYDRPPAGRVKADWPQWVPDTVFPVWDQIARALALPDGSPDPYVCWEPLNEPANVSWSTWLAAYQSIVSYFRQTVGYTGVLICDGLDGSTSWDAASFDSLSAFDAARSGMHGEPQLAFTNHDYALTSVPSRFSAENWLGETLARTTKDAAVPAASLANQYCRFETEFGNNVDGRGGNTSWSDGAASFFAALPSELAGFAGGFAYVWGPWSDGNAISENDNTTPTSPWGTTVKRFLASAQATRVPAAS
jgi:hypothetical protein